ncbi:hypothetical protein YC2023_073143 [Brassica napus]
MEAREARSRRLWYRSGFHRSVSVWDDGRGFCSSPWCLGGSGFSTLSKRVEVSGTQALAVCSSYPLLCSLRFTAMVRGRPVSWL